MFFYAFGCGWKVLEIREASDAFSAASSSSIRVNLIFFFMSLNRFYLPSASHWPVQNYIHSKSKQNGLGRLSTEGSFDRLANWLCGHLWVQLFGRSAGWPFGCSAIWPCGLLAARIIKYSSGWLQFNHAV